MPYSFSYLAEMLEKLFQKFMRLFDAADLNRDGPVGWPQGKIIFAFKVNCQKVHSDL